MTAHSYVKVKDRQNVLKPAYLRVLRDEPRFTIYAAN